MLYIARLPDGRILDNKLYKTKSSMPLSSTYTYYAVEPNTMTLTPLTIREMRANPAAAKKTLEENLRHHDRGYPEGSWGAEHVKDIKALIEIFS